MEKKIKFNVSESTISYNDIIYKFTSEQLDKIINSSVNFKLYDCNDLYVSYLSTNNRKIYLIEYLYKFKYDLHKYEFKNNNIYDLRPENIIIYHKYNEIINQTFNNAIFFPGHFKIHGYDAYIMKNPYWKIVEEDGEKIEEYYLMYCEPDIVIKLNDNSLQNILYYERNFNDNKKLTFFKINNYDIRTKLHNNNIININKILNCKNKQNFDYRCDNLTKNFENINTKNNYHPYHYEIIKKYPEAIYYAGHIAKGRALNSMKNPYWKIIDENNDKYYLMYCETNTIFKLDDKSLEIIRDYEKNNNQGKRITLYKHHNGYIVGHFNNLYVHQIIMNLFGQGKGTNNFSVDHINRDRLDNRYSNLRIATLKEQQDNSYGILEGTKRNRKYNAQELPNGIDHSDLPKYVYYCNEKYNEKGDTRDFFRIEKHPNQTNPISTSKSINITIHDKLNEAKQIVEKLDNNTYYKTEDEFKLPIGFYVTKFRDSDHLVYDYRNIETKERKNMKMKLPENYNLENEYNKLLVKINEKYLVENKEIEPEKETVTITENKKEPDKETTKLENEFKLPKGFYVSNAYSKPKLVYTINNANCRREMKMNMPEKYNLENEYNKLLEKIKIKWQTELEKEKSNKNNETMNNIFTLPINFNIRVIKGKTYLVYAENKNNCKRQMSIVIPDDYDLKCEYEKILKRIDQKYNKQDNDGFKLPSNFSIKTDKGNLIIKYSKMIDKIKHDFQVKLPENYNLEEEYNKFLPKLYEKFPNLQEINNK